MKVSIEFDEEELLRDVMQNYPEYSSPSIVCTKYDYNRMIFCFTDVEENKKHIIDICHLKHGLKTLLTLLSKDKLPGLSINLNNFQDTGEWDADCTDALVQCAIFGKVIYG